MHIVYDIFFHIIRFKYINILIIINRKRYDLSYILYTTIIYQY